MQKIKHYMRLMTLSRFFSKKSEPELSVGECWSSCDEMPMYNFIKLSVTGELKWLIKSGVPTDLDVALSRIQSEYAELSGDIEMTNALKNCIQVDYLSNKLSIFTSIVERLRVSRVDELINELIGMGFRYKYDDLNADLNRAETQSKQLIVQLNKAKSVNKNQDRPSEISWLRRLSAIAKYRQVPSINPRLISVAEYIAMDIDFNEYVNFMKSQENGR